jgi:thiosulfate/3-mercaptopyruvate sulfurtransferase
MARRFSWWVLLFGVLTLGQLPATAEPRQDLLIETVELAGRLAKGDFVLIDAEPAEAYARAHIPGAVNLYYMDLEDAEENAKNGRPIFPQMAANRFGDLGVAANSAVVVYDSGNGRGASAVWYILRYIGHERVRVLDGGFRKWVREGRPVSQDVPKLGKARYALGTPRADWALTTEQVSTGKGILVDARALAEFAGKESGGARQAGHIPGAVSFPWDRLADRLATFKSDAAMRKALADAGLTPEKEIVTYCNPGLGRSTVLLLALTLLGYDKVKVYPGSYLEWAADPSRPIAR